MLSCYTLGYRLGEGVYSEVFAGRRNSDGRRCAVKILKSCHNRDAWAVQCFRREAAAGRAARHPALLPIVDSRLTAPPFYHVSPLIDGCTLRNAGAGPWREVVALLRQVGG